MNWTGGRLSRHSRRADSSTTSKQKQHFAKMRSHLMSGSMKKDSAKRPNFDMAGPRPLDGLPVRDGTVRTQLQQPLVPLNHDLHSDHGSYVKNMHSGIYSKFYNSPWERSNPESRPCRQQSPWTTGLSRLEQGVPEFNSQLRNETKAD